MLTFYENVDAETAEMWKQVAANYQLYVTELREVLSSVAADAVRYRAIREPGFLEKYMAIDPSRNALPEGSALDVDIDRAIEAREVEKKHVV